MSKRILDADEILQHAKAPSFTREAMRFSRTGM